MALESVGLIYELAKLGWEAGKLVRNEAKAVLTGSTFRFVASLSTLEFVENGSEQQAHYVLDRTVKFLRRDTTLPAFTYKTGGTDTVESLVVDDKQQTVVPVENGGRTYYKPAEDMTYSRGDSARAVFEVCSVNGFGNHHEYFSLRTEYLTDAATLVIIFPASRQPSNVRLLYQTQKDPKDRWRPASRERSELRHTTQKRVAFTWESKNLRLGNQYKVEWDW